jgi:glycosyltransferase involved in cell wall biosynthesis
MNLLFVAYYFPPMGLSGVTRILKFVKYLSEMGWDVQVLTGSPASYYAFDESLLEEIPRRVRVIRTGSLDLHHIGGGGEKKVRTPLPASAGRRLSRFLLVPDSKIGWYPFAVSAGRRIVATWKPRVVYASAPPWTSFLVGSSIAKRSGAHLVLDYRDSWLMDSQSPQPTFLHRLLSSRLEARIVARSSAVVAVNEWVRRELVSRYPGIAHTSCTIYNGFDPEDFSRLPDVEVPFARPGADCLRLIYTGTLYPDVNRQKRRATVPPIEVVFMGVFDERYARRARELGIDDVVRFVPYMPHREALSCLVAADAAILLVDSHPHADRHVPGKLFEYLGAGKPVLALAPRGSEAAHIVEENGAGAVLPPDDPDAVAELLDRWIDLKLSGGALPSAAKSSLDLFDRRKQSRRLDGVLRALTGE